VQVVDLEAVGDEHPGRVGVDLDRQLGERFGIEVDRRALQRLTYAEPLERVDLSLVGAAAVVLGVELGDMFELEVAPPPGGAEGMEMGDLGPDQTRRLAALLDQIGQRCRDAGARFSYHNHAFEFVRLPAEAPTAAGTTAYALDLLLGWTDAELVKWEPDVYWIARAGEDPVAYIDAYAGRCPLVHIKDMADDAERSFAPVGAGTLDLPAICEAAELGGAEWLIVEQDRSVGPAIESVARSVETLRGWGKL
jgi:sugar phosphate isomerase/epimerase